MTVLFPSLPGLGFSVHKEPQFSTRIQRAVSGRELRVVDQPNPIWIFTLVFNFLRDQWYVRQAGGLGVGYDELETLMGFFLGQQGSFTAFYFNDPTDNSRLAEPIATGDGSTVAFQLVRRMPAGAAAGLGFTEPIIAPNTISAVYLNGVSQPNPGAWTSGSTGLITFTSAPGNGVAITADFTYYFLVRFHDDNADFENFLFQLWTLKQLKLQSVLL